MVLSQRICSLSFSVSSNNTEQSETTSMYASWRVHQTIIEHLKTTCEATNLIPHHTLPLKNASRKGNSTLLHDICWGDRKNRFFTPDRHDTDKIKGRIPLKDVGKPMTLLGFSHKYCWLLDNCVTWELSGQLISSETKNHTLWSLLFSFAYGCDCGTVPSWGSKKGPMNWISSVTLYLPSTGNVARSNIIGVSCRSSMLLCFKMVMVGSAWQTKVYCAASKSMQSRWEDKIHRYTVFSWHKHFFPNSSHTVCFCW